MISNFEFRIAKLGTRPKGGSPQDNFEIIDPQSTMIWPLTSDFFVFLCLVPTA